MKELSIEQKAQAYDEALENIKKLVSCGLIYEDAAIQVFPILKQSEDEEIKKSLIGHLKECRNNTRSEVMIGEYAKWISWLEKQGEKGTNGNESEIPNSEQKSVDKVEPKFKVGDLVTNGNLVGKIDEIHVWGCHAYFGDYYADITDVENWHKWTIKDAKDGDVLADGNLPFIFKKIDANKYCYAYCGLSVDDGFKIESDGKYGEWTWRQDIKPATKEQRDLLFQKMKEAGYEWSAEKKELKKIKQKIAEWSEDVEAAIRLLKNIAEEQEKDYCPYNANNLRKVIQVLETYRTQNSWKPSDEQMKQLGWIAKQNKDNMIGKELMTLYNDLKKVREEYV